MDTENYEKAREGIRQVMVAEYVKKNPEVKPENVFLISCNGKLVAADASKIMADKNLRENLINPFMEGKSIFKSLKTHQNPQWVNCVTSIEFSNLILTAMKPSYYSKHHSLNICEELKWLERQKLKCGKATLELSTAEEKIAELSEDDVKNRSSKARTYIMAYLHIVVKQLSFVLDVFNKEVSLGDILSNVAKNYIDFQWAKIQSKAQTYDEGGISKIFQALKGDKNVKIGIFIANEKSLQRSKDLLIDAIDMLKIRLDERREQIHEILQAISSINSFIEELSDDESVSSESNSSNDRRRMAFTSSNKRSSR